MRLRALLVLLFAAASSCAADITGSWAGAFAIPDHGVFTVTFKLKQVGAKLTGVIVYPNAKEQPIDNGKVDGDQVTFAVTNTLGQAFTAEGKVSGDEIALTFSPGNGDSDKITLTRQK